MKKGSLNIIELHVEKLILALAVGFMLFVVVFYMLGPNRVNYKGRELGPDEIDEAIYAEAQRLQQAISNHRPETQEVPDFAAELRRKAREGLYVDETVPRELPVAVSFNVPLQTFEDAEGGSGEDIELVKPLAPVAPALRTGISLVESQAPLRLGPVAGARAEVEQGERESKSLSWVTVGAYFPDEAQRQEMINAGYAGYMSKVYLVGTEAQRQEMTDSGDWTDWVDVDLGSAMPKVNIPEPVLDDRSGVILNQDELDGTLDQVKAYQAWLKQPRFLPVDAGDDWAPPPLAGHEDDFDLDEEEEEEDEEEEERPAVSPQPTDRSGGRAPPTATGGGRAGSRFGGGRAGGRMGGGRAGGGQAGAGRAPAQPRTGAGARPQEGRREVRQLFKDLGEAFAEKNYNEVQNIAENIKRHSAANRGDKRKADKYLKRVERIRERTEDLGGEPEYVEFVRRPETNEPAIWFHDTTVEPGKTYRYRMRARLWNRYVGRMEAMKNPDDARRVVLVGDWSLPSDSITVAPKQHFFVSGRRFGEPPAARVDVFRWYDGDWLKETFEVQVGDVIGELAETRIPEWDKDLRPKRKELDFSTNAVVLDVRYDEPVLQRRVTGREGTFAYDERDALVLVYLDPADGQIKQRIDAIDRNDAVYRKLKKEYDELMD
jgi:hypothetical protein